MYIYIHVYEKEILLRLQQIFASVYMDIQMWVPVRQIIKCDQASKNSVIEVKIQK